MAGDELVGRFEGESGSAVGGVGVKCKTVVDVVMDCLGNKSPVDPDVGPFNYEADRVSWYEYIVLIGRRGCGVC